jgi:PBP1b-binding outer membrane lipoprotein LpoB
MSISKLILIGLSCAVVLGGCRKPSQPPKPTATAATQQSSPTPPTALPTAARS